MTMAFEPWNVARGAEIITEHAKLDGATLVICTRWRKQPSSDFESTNDNGL